jgi:hypothetical protein
MHVIIHPNANGKTEKKLQFNNKQAGRAQGGKEEENIAIS